MWRIKRTYLLTYLRTYLLTYIYLTFDITFGLNAMHLIVSPTSDLRAGSRLTLISVIVRCLVESLPYAALGNGIFGTQYFIYSLAAPLHLYLNYDLMTPIDFPFST